MRDKVLRVIWTLTGSTALSLLGDATFYAVLPTSYAAVGVTAMQVGWLLSINRLARIPYGERVTYGAIATEIGNPGLAQRVGQAVGHNPVSIIIPCHRVVGADGSLTGYAGGLDRKRTLLALESPSADAEGRLF